MKIHLSSVIALALSFSGFLYAQDSDRIRVATVDMQALFKEFHGTNETKLKFEGERERVTKDAKSREKALMELRDEAELIKKQLSDPSVSAAKKQDLFRDRQTKQQEFEGLKNELQDFVERKSRALNEQMQIRMKDILEEIQGKVRAHAEAEGYDYVLDKTGTSTSQVPILLYTKDATDITGVLLKTINEGAPAPAAEE